VGTHLFISLVYNTSLLLVLVAIYSGIKFKIPFESALPSRTRDILTGILIGLIGVALMASPWKFKPGIYFDARSVLLCVTGLFFGLIPTVLAVVIIGSFRIFVDGVGALSGLGVILTSAGLGLLWQRWRPGLKQQGKLLELYLFGLLVHLLMLACMFILPRPVAFDILRHISLPVMIIFPVGTVLLSILIIRQNVSRQMNEKLWESKKLLESVVENVPLMIFLKEAKDLRYVIFNHAGEELLGYDRKALLGKNDLDLFPPEQAAQFMAGDREVLNGETGVLDIPEEFIDTAGKGRRVLHTNKVCIRGNDGDTKYLLGISEDITERKKIESDMHESYEMERMSNAIRQNSLLPISLHEKLTINLASLLSIPWLTLEPKGSVFLVSGENMHLAVQQGLAPASLVLCAKIPFGKCLCGKAAESGEIFTSTDVGPEHETVYEGMQPHGHCCVPIIAAGTTLGVLNLYLKAGADISAKQLEFIRTVANIIALDIVHSRVEEQFAQSQKMEAIGQMAGGIAHDLNNILTAIIGYGNFLSAAIPVGDPKHADSDEIIKAGERAATLIHQLLTFSRKQVVQSSALNLDQIIPETIKMLRRMIPENIEFKTHLKSAPANVLANQGQLGQVIINLAVNARDAMPKGGILTFETAQTELDKNYASTHVGVLPGRYVMLAVSDTGNGMSPEVVAHLFEPFFTTKEQGKGTGLGLSTVYGIVKQSGGNIFVYSELGKGTTFKIYLPIVAEKAGETPVKKSSIMSYRGTETILLVEDEDAVRKFVSRLLSQNGYSVLEAATPREAIAFCEARHDITLMLTDLIMPQMDGYVLAKTVATLAPLMKVVFMSGYTDNVLTQQNLMKPGTMLLEKPLKEDTILRKVREVLNGEPQLLRSLSL